MPSFRIAAVAAFSILAAAPGAAQPAATQLVVQVGNFGFAPRPIHLAAGRPVTLTFVNQSGSGHDFTARGFFQHSKISSGAAPEDEIELGPHQTRSITLIPARGTWQAHCSHFLHKQMGMSDTIVVD
jgi:plastocyanin